MIQTFPIEFIRQILAQKLYEEHIKNPYFFGGDDQINIFSFYEQLKNQNQVDRFTQMYRDLVEQQNRSGLIGNGVIVSPENPTITNLYTKTIIPMSWTCSMRVKLSNRDQMIQTINNLIEELKGSKVDVAQLECVDDYGKVFYQPFCVGTIGHNLWNPTYNSGDYIGYVGNVVEEQSVNSTISSLISSLYNRTGIGAGNSTDYLYYSAYVDGKYMLRVATKNRMFPHYSYEPTLLTSSTTIGGEEYDAGSQIEDIHYEHIQGPTTTTINGSISFTTNENYFRVPSADNIVMTVVFYVVDDENHIRYFEEPVVVDEDSLTITSENKLTGTASFAFDIEDDEWDMNSIHTDIDYTHYHINGDGNTIYVKGHVSFDFNETYDTLPDLDTLKIYTTINANDSVRYNKNITKELFNVRLSLSNGKISGDGWFDFKLSSQDVNRQSLVISVVSGEYYVLNGDYYDEWYDAIDDGTHPNVIFPPEHRGFEKYKVSLSFESIRCDEPRTLNGDEYCEISFGGSATIVDASIKLGNDLVKVGIRKDKIIYDNTTRNLNGSTYWVEPLEMPSGNNANTIMSQLSSNNFKQNTHTDGLALSLQYTFMLDYNNDLINSWFKYARYGIFGDIYTPSAYVSPNLIYVVSEYWSWWGIVFRYDFPTKIIEAIEIENTESDTLTITIPMQIQGDNH